MSAPWMPLYVADYLADTLRLTTLEHGAYLLLIMDYWRNGCLPDDDRKLARIAGLTADEWTDIRENLADLFLPGWKHKRVDAELQKAGRRSDTAKAKAEKRWQSSSNAAAQPQQSSGNAKSLSQSYISEADASLVNSTVDGCEIKSSGNEKKRALREALQSFGEQWNELAAGCRLKTIDEIKSGSPRERRALARLREMPDGGAALLAHIRGSPYLLGEVNGFMCTFDWIINPSNFQKIMEGNYENRKATGRH